MKIVLRIAFLSLAMSLMALLSSWFNHKSAFSTTVSDFFASSTEYDVLAFGPSYMYLTVVPPELYRVYGIRSFVIGTPCQPINETYYYIKVALDRFAPKVILVGADMIVLSPNRYVHSSAYAHEAVDGFPWGLSRFNMIADLQTDAGYDEFVVPFIKYHSRWKSLGVNDFVSSDKSLDFNGYTVNVNYGFKNNVKKYNLATCARSKIFEENLRWLDRITKLTQKAGCRLALVATPRYHGVERLASLHDYCEKNGIEFIDLLLDFDNTGIMNETDYLDVGHLNSFGAEKATRYIGKWLVDHYDFNLTKTTEDRAWWESEVKRYSKTKEKTIAEVKKKKNLTRK